MKVFKQVCDAEFINGKSHAALNMQLEDYHCKANLEDDDVLSNGEANECFNIPLALTFVLCMQPCSN